MKTSTLPELKDGEIYAGIVLSEDGTPVHHVILLPGDNEANNWQAQNEWARSIGGDLPTRREQSVLFANCKEHFEERDHWSSEEYSSGAAWYQYFGNGCQGRAPKYDALCARAVRRVEIK